MLRPRSGSEGCLIVVVSTTEVILALIGLVVAGGQGYLAYAANRQTELARQADDRQRAADDAAEKRRKDEEDKRVREREAEQRQRAQLEDRRFAVAIVEAVTTRQVREILHDPAPSAADTDFVAGLHDLCAVKVDRLLTDDVRDDTTIVEPIDRALRPLQQFLAARGVAFDAAAIEAKLHTNDTSKHAWEGEGRHGKIWVLNLVAERFVAEHGITTVAEFERSFGDQVAAALPGRSFRRDRMLISEAAHAALARQYLDRSLLHLDGQAFGLAWSCGFPNRAVGTEVHVPLIAHFARLGYPITPVQR